MKICDAIDQTFEFSSPLSWLKALGISYTHSLLSSSLLIFFSFSCSTLLLLLLYTGMNYFFSYTSSYFFIVMWCLWHQIRLTSPIPTSSHHHPKNGPSLFACNDVLATHPKPLCLSPSSRNPSSQSTFSKPSKFITPCLIHHSFLLTYVDWESMGIRLLKYQGLWWKNMLQSLSRDLDVLCSFALDWLIWHIWH